MEERNGGWMEGRIIGRLDGCESIPLPSSLHSSNPPFSHSPNLYTCQGSRMGW